MADARAAVSYEGLDYHAVTIAHDSTIVYDATKVNGAVQVGLAVAIESDGLVTLVGDGENVYGKLIKVESDGFCVVQDEGYCQLPGGSGATLTAGLKIVGDLGAASAEGYIQAVSTQDTVSRGIIVDASVATAVWVKLG
jgi:hypothetical protein